MIIARSRPRYTPPLSFRASLPTTTTFLLSFLFFETKQPTYLSLSFSLPLFRRVPGQQRETKFWLVLYEYFPSTNK